jgi:hypothetical protein
MEDVRREVSRRRTFFDRTHWGVRCPACRTVLGVVRWPIFVIGYSAFVGAGLALLKWVLPAAERVSKDLAFLAVIAFLLAWAWLADRCAPFLARLRRPEPNERLVAKKPIEEELAEDPEYQQQLAELDERNAWIESAGHTAGPPWRCGSCGEENPPNFDVCWNCEKARPTP